MATAARLSQRPERSRAPPRCAHIGPFALSECVQMIQVSL